MSKKSRDQKPVDVLAAEEFPVGEAAAHEPGEGEQPHDVLAADQFAMPAPDPALHGDEQDHGPGPADDHGHQHGHEHDDGPVIRIGSVPITPRLAQVGAAIAGGLVVIFRLRRRRRRRKAARSG